MTILQRGRPRPLTHRVRGLTVYLFRLVVWLGLSAPRSAVKPVGRQPLEGSPHPEAREAWTPPPAGFPTGPSPCPPPPPLPAPIRMVSLLLFICEGRAGCREAAPQWACPGGLPPWRPSFRFGLGCHLDPNPRPHLWGLWSPAPAKGLRSCSL